jgi:hypothetical protein
MILTTKKADYSGCIPEVAIALQAGRYPKIEIIACGKKKTDYIVSYHKILYVTEFGNILLCDQFELVTE